MRLSELIAQLKVMQQQLERVQADPEVLMFVGSVGKGIDDVLVSMEDGNVYLLEA